MYVILIIKNLEGFTGYMVIKTLLVDDDSSLLEQAKIFLEKISDELDVSTVSSAEKGLKLLDKERYDVIVSDYQMPVMNGLE
ncbi:MAG: response regulator, partial [Candidatus Saliniplasma sp.]